MFILGDIARSVVNVSFHLIGVWMAHSFYQSSRRRYQTVLAWIIGFIYCLVTTQLIKAAQWLPHSSFEQISNITGIGALLIYVYLFTGVPLAQRVFTYFFVDNCLYLIVIVSRTTALPASAVIPLAQDALFMLLFALLAGGFLLLFSKKLKKNILRGLTSFQNHFPVLTLYACVSYISTLAFIDPWGPMDMPTLGIAFSYLVMCGMVVCGYVLVFRVLHALRTAQDAEAESNLLSTQLVMSKEYYSTLMDRMEQYGARQHDFNHHLRAMDGMLRQGETEKLGAYLEGLLAGSKEQAPIRYCDCYVGNVLLNYYAGLAKSNGLTFTVKAAMPEWDGKNSYRLCLVMGNLLQNALEACLRMASSENRFISFASQVINNTLMIDVKNSFDGVVIEEGGHIRSRKTESGHGLGLNNISSVVEENGGVLRIAHEKGVFRCQVALYLPPEALQ